MDYNGFKFICNVKEGIPNDILDACKPFVIKEMRDWNMDSPLKITKTAQFDFGYSELDDITDRAKSIKRIKASIIQSIMDCDSLGRNMNKVRYKQLLKKPHKGLQRIVLKSFYLHSMNLSEAEPSKGDINDVIDNLWMDTELRI
jgi:hypothetical protein